MRTAPGMFATGLLVCITAVPLAAGIVLMSDHSPALPVAIAIAIAGAAAMLLTRDLTRAMFLGFLVVLPFDISKALLPPDTVYYYPGFWLSISDLFLLGFLLPWFFGRKLIGREPFLTNPLVPFAIVYTAYLWVSALMAVSPTHGMVMALTHTKFLVAFLAISDYVRKPADLHAAGLAFAAGLVIELTIVAAQLVTRSYLQIPGTGLADTGNLTFSGGIQTFRPTGFLKHPIALADYLVFMLLPGAALVLAGRRSIGRAWGFILLLTLGAGIALVATLSTACFQVFFATSRWPRSDCRAPRSHSDS